MQRTLFAVCACSFAALLMGAGSEVAIEDADLVMLEGEGEVAVLTGAEIYRVKDENSGRWRMLFTRDEGAAEILVNAAPGTYDVQVWSIPASPANPSRVHTVSTLTVDGEQQEPTLIDTPLMLDLLASFGPCSGGCAFDLDANGSVDMSDLLLLLGNWGEPWEG